MTNKPDDFADDPAFQEYAEHVVREMLPKMQASAFVIISPPTPDTIRDVKFACEIGFALLLNKPLIVFGNKEHAIPRRLRDAADKVVIVDMKDEKSKERASREITAFLKKNYPEEFRQ